MQPEGLSTLVRLLERLPGVGEKTALRFALWLAAAGGDVARDLGREIAGLPDRIGPCARCGNVAERAGDDPPVCGICADGRRDGRLLCVVARVQDLLAVERSGTYRGRYFVLGRLLSPLEGVGPEDLPLAALDQRAGEEGVQEIVVATPPTVDGEATALLLARHFAPRGVRVTRIASGVPHGGDLEFADPVTLGRAIEGRRPL